MVNLTELLYCPITHLKLQILDESKINSINAAITAGNLNFVNGNKCKNIIEEGLIREDGNVVYEIRFGIPVLIPDSGIDISNLKTSFT